MVFSSLVDTGSSSLQFHMDDTNHVYVNSIRRSLMRYVKTVAISPEQNDDAFIRNTSNLNNQFLQHRFCLVPMFVNDINTFNPDEWQVHLHVRHEGRDVRDVTSQDFQVYNRLKKKYDSQKKKEWFQPDPITGEYVMLTKLYPSLDGYQFDEIHCELSLQKESGHTHACHTPISCASFMNRVDMAKYNEVLSMALRNKNDEEAEAIRHQYDTIEKFKHYISNEFGEPIAFRYTIEPIGQYTAKECVRQALVHLKQKLQMFKYYVTGQHESISYEFEESGCTVTIKNEEHTLGTLLQKCMFDLYTLEGGSASPELSLVGYQVDNPLIHEMTLRMVPTVMEKMNESYIRQLILKACDVLVTLYDEWLQEWTKTAGLESLADSSEDGGLSSSDSGLTSSADGSTESGTGSESSSGSSSSSGSGTSESSEIESSS